MRAGGAVHCCKNPPDAVPVSADLVTVSLVFDDGVATDPRGATTKGYQLKTRPANYATAKGTKSLASVAVAPGGTFTTALQNGRRVGSAAPACAQRRAGGFRPHVRRCDGYLGAAVGHVVRRLSGERHGARQRPRRLPRLGRCLWHTPTAPFSVWDP